MGLCASILRTLIRTHGDQPFQGPVVTLGVQDIAADYPGLVRLFDEERVAHRPVPEAERKGTTSHYLRASNKDASSFVHPRVFFHMLGIDGYDDLDFADFEQPTLIHDLNRPIPPAWHGKFGLVLDGGTTEHIFDTRSVFANLVDLVRVGGDVVHISPMAGWTNHGFYQLNPCLFYDFYQCNGFEIRAAHLAYLPKDPRKGREVVRPFQYTEHMFDAEERDARVLFAFRATKRVCQPLAIPVQGHYRRFAPTERKAV